MKGVLFIRDSFSFIFVALMFGLFKKNKKGTKVIDKVVPLASERFNAIADSSGSRPTVIICWFDKTAAEAETYFSGQQVACNCTIVTAREAQKHLITGREVIFAEHYPLHEKEEELYNRLELKEAIVFSSLEDAFFEIVGGEKIRSLVQKLGLEPGEIITHSMISSSIRFAQIKIAKKVKFDNSARSQEEWFQKNITV
jgi:hypothetical protein